VIGLFELTYTAQVYGSQGFVIFELLIVATFYYLVLTTLWGYVQNWIERRMDPNRTTKYDIAERKEWTERMVGFGSSGTGVR
jgi:polar amino acid transport system permease protein